MIQAVFLFSYFWILLFCFSFCSSGARLLFLLFLPFWRRLGACCRCRQFAILLHNFTCFSKGKQAALKKKNNNNRKRGTLTNWAFASDAPSSVHPVLRSCQRHSGCTTDDCASDICNPVFFFFVVVFEGFEGWNSRRFKRETTTEKSYISFLDIREGKKSWGAAWTVLCSWCRVKRRKKKNSWILSFADLP